MVLGPPLTVLPTTCNYRLGKVPNLGMFSDVLTVPYSMTKLSQQLLPNVVLKFLQNWIFLPETRANRAS